MYKTVLLFRRNPAMTREEFIDYYETRHSKFIAHLQGVRKYVRRYVTKPDNAHGEPLNFDVIMETWFDDKAAGEAAFARITSLEVWADIVKDEERLFDRTHKGWAIGGVIDIEYETNLSSPTFETTYEVAKAKGK